MAAVLDNAVDYVDDDLDDDLDDAAVSLWRWGDDETLLFAVSELLDLLKQDRWSSVVMRLQVEKVELLADRRWRGDRELNLEIRELLIMLKHDPGLRGMSVTMRLQVEKVERALGGHNLSA